jgi:very-long-chain enoyl-CoA reductase
MTPRIHNVVSYLVAALVLPATTLFVYGMPSATAALALGAWVVHFMRRTAESLWVHRYGKAAFPWSDALIEYVYYWGFGVWIAFELPATPGFDALTAVGCVVFVLAEAGNARAHRHLRALREADPKARSIPRGFLFEWVSCPHYLCEISTWLGFSLIARSWAAGAFALVGSAILTAWATQRHRAYRKDFDGNDGRALYPASRRALLPWVY